uniref:Uncharacterized protein n=1 Tax=Oryza brachyantha TaxID=4533 RepID=J3M1H8_ORYBR
MASRRRDLGRPLLVALCVVALFAVGSESHGLEDFGEGRTEATPAMASFFGSKPEAAELPEALDAEEVLNIFTDQGKQEVELKPPALERHGSVSQVFASLRRGFFCTRFETDKGNGAAELCYSGSRIIHHAALQASACGPAACPVQIALVTGQYSYSNGRSPTPRDLETGAYMHAYCMARGTPVSLRFRCMATGVTGLCG